MGFDGRKPDISLLEKLSLVPDYKVCIGTNKPWYASKIYCADKDQREAIIAFVPDGGCYVVRSYYQSRITC